MFEVAWQLSRHARDTAAAMKSSPELTQLLMEKSVDAFPNLASDGSSQVDQTQRFRVRVKLGAADFRFSQYMAMALDCIVFSLGTQAARVALRCAAVSGGIGGGGHYHSGQLPLWLSALSHGQSAPGGPATRSLEKQQISAWAVWA